MAFKLVLFIDSPKDTTGLTKLLVIRNQPQAQPSSTDVTCVTSYYSTEGNWECLCSVAGGSGKGQPLCRREDKPGQKTTGICGATAHTWTWPWLHWGRDLSGSTLGQGPCRTACGHPACRGQAGSGWASRTPRFCLMLGKNTLVPQAPSALCLQSTGQEGGISVAPWVSVHQGNWVNRSQLARCYKTIKQNIWM